MPKRTLIDQLDAAVEAMMARRDAAPPSSDPLLAGLIATAAALLRLPREDFKSHLKSDLERRALMSTPAQAAPEPRKVKAVPEGYHTVAPYLLVRGAAEAIAFYKRAFGAAEVMRLTMPDGKIGHAEIQIGDSRIMLSDEFPEYGNVGPQTLGGSPVAIHLYVPDVDAFMARAAAEGAQITQAAADFEYGDREGGLKDPFGHSWHISTHKEDVTAEEYFRREALKREGGAPQPSPGRGLREGFQPATPYLTVSDGLAAIEFYKKAFGARETESMRFADPSGRLAHGEIIVGDSQIFLNGESEEYHKRGPRKLGGTPVKLHLYVEDVDAVAARATAAGAKALRPVEDQFYGDRSGQIEDPFGHVWIVSTHIEDITNEEMERRSAAFLERETGKASASRQRSGIRPGFNSVTPYVTVRQPERLLEFVKQAFGATETFRTTGPAGGLHAEARIGNSMVMIAGAPGMTFPERPAALHMYVDDTDAAYQRALQAGAAPIQAPTDHDYGERGASVKDAFGNNWYIATSLSGPYVREGFRTLTPYLHPRSAAKLIDFLKQAFEAEEIARYADPDGRIAHAEVRVGDSMIEMGEAHGPYQPMPTAIYLYVSDVDEMYRRALEAGAKSTQPPTDQPYGDRNAFVEDPLGNTWYIATHVGGGEREMGGA